MADTTVPDDLEAPDSALSAATPLPPLSVQYTNAPLDAVLADARVLAVFGFGAAAPESADARYRRVPLEAVDSPARFEVWRGSADAAPRHDDAVSWSTSGDYAFAALSVDEAAHGGIAGAARHAYRTIGAWLATASHRHVLRIWNYLDAINEGEGDAERYREFCNGRADGMRGIFDAGFPAATAIGARDGRRVLRISWIAARQPGAALENPRQISAWRYPRQYGPSAPTFARAMRAPAAPAQLYVSGTAAIVGHASHHRDDFAAQLDETLTNFRCLLETAGFAPQRCFGAHSMLRVYVRRSADAARAAGLLQARLPHGTPLQVFHGDICRRELLVEIDGVQTDSS